MFRALLFKVKAKAVATVLCQNQSKRRETTFNDGNSTRMDLVKGTIIMPIVEMQPVSIISGFHPICNRILMLNTIGNPYHQSWI